MRLLCVASAKVEPRQEIQPDAPFVIVFAALARLGIPSPERRQFVFRDAERGRNLVSSTSRTLGKPSNVDRYPRRIQTTSSTSLPSHRSASDRIRPGKSSVSVAYLAAKMIPVTNFLPAGCAAPAAGGGGDGLLHDQPDRRTARVRQRQRPRRSDQVIQWWRGSNGHSLRYSSHRSLMASASNTLSAGSSI